MSNNNNGESKDEVAEGKRGKNVPKRRKFRSFSLGEYSASLTTSQIYFLIGFYKPSKLGLVFRIVFFFNLEYFIQGTLISVNIPGSSQRFLVGNN